MEQEYDSLLSIRQRKKELQKEIDASRQEVTTLWNSIFHSKPSKPASRTQRFLDFAATSTSVIDGAILGWKLYRKFRK